MPDEVAGTPFYHPGNNKHEKDIEAKMKYWWGEKYQSEEWRVKSEKRKLKIENYKKAKAKAEAKL